MIVFWVVAGVLSAAAAGLVLHRAARAAGDTVEDPTPVVYRRQLAEIDDLAARGLLAEDERRSAHAEAARRLLGAAEAAPAPWNSAPGAGRGVLMVVLAAAAAALALYAAVGRPNWSDQPFARRLAVWRSAEPMSLTPPELAAVLQQLSRERPNDPDVFRFLAVARGSQDPASAVRALRRAVALAPDRADLWELLGEAESARAGGEVTPEAEAAFRQAVRRDAAAFAARFHLARGQVEGGDKAGGIAAWKALLADMPASDPRRPALVRTIAEAEGRVLPAATSPAGQAAMIRGMVDGLARRLAASPDDPQGWVRLVRAYAVLGETGKRDQAFAAAKARYADRPEILTELDAAARAEPPR
jgi:cytochrome c-type biogenesis protein CcmH